MVFEGQTIKEMLTLYSTLVGGNTSAEEERLLFEDLRKEVHKIDPLYELGNSLTSYQAFLMVANIEPTTSNVMLTFDGVEGYVDNTMEFTPWDPLVPIDDTQQYPDDECVRTNTIPSLPCDVPAREEHVQEEFFQGGEIRGLVTDEIEETSLFDESKPVNDTDQMPDEDNVSTMDRTVFSSDHAGRDFV